MAPKHQGRLYYLACTAELAGVADIQVLSDYEFAIPYLVSERDLATSRNGRLNIDIVRVEFVDADGDTQNALWDCEEEDLNTFVDRVYRGPYQPLDDDVELDAESSREYLQRVSR